MSDKSESDSVAAADAAQSLEARLCRCRLLVLPVGGRALQDVFGTVHAPDLCTATGVEWDAAGKPLLPPGVVRAPGKSCRCPPSNAAFPDAAVCPVHGNAATAAIDSSEFSSGVREGLRQREELTRALRACVEIVDKAGLLNLANGVQLGPTVWYVKAHDIFEDARRALAAQEGREQPGGLYDQFLQALVARNEAHGRADTAEELLRELRYWMAAEVVQARRIREAMLAKIDAALAPRDAARSVAPPTPDSPPADPLEKL